MKILAAVLSMIFLTADLIAEPARAKLGVRVIDDSNQGIPSTVFLTLPDGKQLSLGPTDDDGRLDLIEPCGRGRTLKAQPNDNVNYYNGQGSCPLGDGNILVNKKGYIHTLQVNALALEKKGEPGKAALVYNELTARTLQYNPDQSLENEKKVYTLFFERTQGDADAYLSFDPDQDKVVLNKKGKAAVSHFQQRKGLKVTGKIDYATLSAAASADVGQYLYKAKDHL